MENDDANDGVKSAELMPTRATGKACVGADQDREIAAASPRVSHGPRAVRRQGESNS